MEMPLRPAPSTSSGAQSGAAFPPEEENHAVESMCLAIQNASVRLLVQAHDKRHSFHGSDASSSPLQRNSNGDGAETANLQILSNFVGPTITVVRDCRHEARETISSDLLRCGAIKVLQRN